MLKKIKASITHQILLSSFFAISIGSLLHIFLSPTTSAFNLIVHGIFDLGGQLFLNSLKMLVIPMIFFSLVTGIAGIQDAKQLGRIGFQTLAFFFVTTVLALILGLLISSQIDFAIPILNGNEFKTQTNLLKQVTNPSLKETLINIIPSNPFQAMANGETLQVIVFSILFGYALSQNQRVGASLLNVFTKFNIILLDLILLLVKIAPIGVFCLLAKTFSEFGFSTMLPLAKYFFVLLLVLLIHGWIVYGLILKYVVKVSPFQFFKKFSQVQIFAFSTSSSNATLPLTLETAEKKLGISNRIASFVIPLGATLNMNGTSIMHAVATVFIAKVYNIDLTLTQYALVVATATLAAIGTAGVPGVGIVMLTMVLQQVNLPIEGISLILGVDRLLDMVRTSVNVTGDAIAALWVAKIQPSAQGDWNAYIFYTHQQDLSE